MRIISIALLTFLPLLSCACSKKRAPEPIVVHVFRDPTAKEVNSALLAAGLDQLVMSDGRPIIIATSEGRNYADGLAMVGNQDHPDLLILNAPGDAKSASIDTPLQSAGSISGRQYFFAIPSWTSGEDRKAAEVVSGDIRARLQKDK